MLGLGWLASQLGKAGGLMKGGLQKLGSGIGRIGGKNGQIGDWDSADGGMGYRTPGFNPAAETPGGAGFSFDRPMPRIPAAGLDEVSTSIGPSDIQTSVPYRATGATALAKPQPMPPALLQAPNTYQRDVPGARVENVPIPGVPGVPGGPQPYDPIAKERFDYVYKRMPKDESGVERPPTRGERFKAGLMPMLAGAARGAQATPGNPIAGMIGGAGTGYALGVANPNAGSTVAFNTFTQPRLEADEARREGQYRRAVDHDRAGLAMQKDQADVEYRRAQTEATRAGMKDAALEREYRRSQITLNDARAQAVATGKPVVRDIVDETGQIRTYQVYPDGSMTPLGGSARAAINTQNVESRERIADERNQTSIQTTGMRQAGATQRTQMTQEGQDRRATGRTGGGAKGGKSATMADVKEYARRYGISEDQALQKFQTRGYQVK